MASGPARDLTTFLFDDFSATPSKDVWDFNHFTSGGSFYGRTQQRQELPQVSAGALHLKLDMFNPTGFSFFGSEIISGQTFSTYLGGIAFEAKARIVTPVAGIVGGLFGYNIDPATGLHSEVDFELLGNDAAAGRNQAQTNVYSNEPLGAGHPQFAPVTDLTAFHDYRMEWFPDRVRWFIDGALVREDTAHVPVGELALHMNIWAPGPEWAEAFSASLQPTADAAQNRSFFVDIDSARVTLLESRENVTSNAFDARHYLAANPDVVAAGVDPYQHFLNFGAKEGRDPSALFSTIGYGNANPDVNTAGVNPLLHYDGFGWREGRDPGPNFDTLFYLVHNPDVAAASVNPLAHYLKFGIDEDRLVLPAVGRSVTPTDFDPDFYLMSFADVAAAGVDPFRHFADFGWREGRDPNGLFDTSFYLANNPDVAAAGVNPLLHYAQFGWKEGRDPSTRFSTGGYLAANPDVAAAQVDPLNHFLVFGLGEGRLPL